MRSAEEWADEFIVSEMQQKPFNAQKVAAIQHDARLCFWVADILIPKKRGRPSVSKIAVNADTQEAAAELIKNHWKYKGSKGVIEFKSVSPNTLVVILG